MKELLFSSQPKSPFLSFPFFSPHSKLLHRISFITHSSSSSSQSPSLTSPQSKLHKTGRPIKARRTVTPSLYSRPSLLHMDQSRAASRQEVYKFLRELGIVPDELDGLELPTTIDVMKERIEFLHSVGLTIDDVNSYPLMLGCSVKKNMIPVLDYLGKIGIRKSVITEFLRRYPQVLHASVIVDLVPVVKYLHGMDIKPANIPKVLERYPEVLGYKLEGTMSTSVAYLVAIGVQRREIGSVLTKFPEILGMRVGRVIKPFVDHLEGIGLPRGGVARLIESKPYVLGFGLERVGTNLEALVEFGVRRESLGSVVVRYPDLLGFDLGEKLVSQRGLLESSVLIGREEFGVVVEKMPQVVSLSRDMVLKHVSFLKSCGFLVKQVSEMAVKCPQILALNLEIMKMSFEFFRDEMERDLEELVEFPAFFTYGIESTVRKRHEIVSKKGLKCSLAWLLNCSDAKFEERMKYDFIGIEEMGLERESEGEREIDEFDMDKFSEPRTEESDYEEDESEFDDSGSDGDYF